MHFGHVLTAMVTPFDQNDQVDFDQLALLIEHLIAQGSDGLVVCGTTGESAVLTGDEKQDIMEKVVAVVDRRVPVIAGTGTNSTQTTIEHTKHAENIGVDGIMLVAPYYNRPNQQGLYEHFKAAAEETSLPVMLYNIPSRCGVHIHAETVIQLSKMANIVALKEASGNLEHAATVISHTPDDFYMYSGDDSMTLPLLSIGATGVVSVASHVIGRQMNEMVHAFLAGKVRQAAALHQQLLPVMKGLFMSPSPAPVKAALTMQGLNMGSVRLPLVALTEEEQIRLEDLLQMNRLKEME